MVHLLSEFRATSTQNCALQKVKFEAAGMSSLWKIFHWYQYVGPRSRVEIGNGLINTYFICSLEMFMSFMQHFRTDIP